MFFFIVKSDFFWLLITLTNPKQWQLVYVQKNKGETTKIIPCLNFTCLFQTHLVSPSSDVMLAALAIWIVPRGFIKSLQPCYYPKVSYFYLSAVIISIPSRRAKLGNLNASLQLEKANEKQNIRRRGGGKSSFLFLIPLILKLIFKFSQSDSHYTRSGTTT